MEKLKQNSGREKVDSSLERICDEDEEFEDNGENDDFEVCMSKMICYGLFCEENRKYINKIIEIT